MTTKREATLAVQAAEARLGVTWAQLAEAVGAPLVWTTAALLGQHPMNVAQAQAAASMLELDQDVARALQAQPTRGALDAAVPVDPTIYRFYERAPGLRPDDQGAHSRTARRWDHERHQLPPRCQARSRSGGDRVVVTLDGKFLPYQW
jgi:cyanate lyase